MLLDITSTRTKILLAALPDVPFDGWTPELLARAADRLKLRNGDIRQAFPHGVRDLVAYFFIWAADETLKKISKKKMGEMRVRDRITLGVRTRLEILAPHKAAVAAALSFLALPLHSLSAPRLVWHTADKIWWAAGDTATDYNHYTKRALLSAVLTSTTLFWLNDSSKDHAPTWEFLDRRIDNVLTIGMKIAQLKKVGKG